MNPEIYLKKYLEPLGGGKNEAAARPPERLPFLPRERYYSSAEPAHYMYNFEIERLTRDELLRMVRETGIGDPAQMKPGQFLGILLEREAISAERLALFEDRDRQLIEARRMLQARPYVAFRKLIVPLKLARDAVRYGARGIRHLRRKVP